MPRRAARSRMPSVPMAVRPSARAKLTPARSSIKISSAPTDYASAIAARSPSPSFGNGRYRPDGSASVQARRDTWPPNHVNTRRTRTAQLRNDGLRNNDFAKKLRQELNGVDQDQLMPRPGVRDDDPHTASKSEPKDVFDLPLDVSNGVILIDPMRLEEAVKLVETLKPQSAAELRLGQPTGPIFLGGKPSRPRRSRSPPAVPSAVAVASGIRSVKFMCSVYHQAGPIASTYLPGPSIAHTGLPGREPAAGPSPCPIPTSQRLLAATR